MTKTIQMSERFGSFCSDGEKAINFFRAEIKPCIDKQEPIEFDFNTVRGMNSSFSNALFANIAGVYGRPALSLITLRNCNSTIKVLISSAFTIGLQRSPTK